MAKKSSGDRGERQDSYKEMNSQNKRRAALGVQVRVFDDSRDSFFEGNKSWYLRGCSFQAYSGLLQSFVGVDSLLRIDRWKMLRRSRDFLSRREIAVDSVSFPSLYGRNQRVVSVLDCFPALKYSYSAPLPGHVMSKIFRGFYGQNTGTYNQYATTFNRRVSASMASPVCYFDVYCNPDGSSKRARFNGISRSGNIRLDPVDAVRQLYLYRLRIQRCLSWGYSIGLVPIMMTVTVFHRWHPLKGLLDVLSNAWNYFFNASTAAVKRSKRMGLVGYIRRGEETINNGSRETGYNSGWHPHYHVILFVPADKVSVVASMEDELREAWFHAVNRFFEKEFGESIDPSYEAAFRRHGLFFSKVRNEVECARIVNDFGTDGTINNIYTNARRSDSLTKFIHGEVLELRQVDDSEYMAKVFGCESSSLYCGDTELTSGSKGSRVPFDLLLEDTAENNDLWVEYALATKGVRCFVFSHGLEKKVKAYFDEHPDRDPIPKLTKSTKVVAQISTRIYKVVEKNFKVDEMMRVAVKGYEALCDWFRSFYIERGIPADKIAEDMLPLPPNSRTIFGDVIHAEPEKVDQSTVVDVDISIPSTADCDEQSSISSLSTERVESAEERRKKEAEEKEAAYRAKRDADWKERVESFRRAVDPAFKGQLSLFDDSVQMAVPVKSKPGRRKKFHYQTVDPAEVEASRARQAAKPKFYHAKRVEHDPANDIDLPEADEITEIAYGKYSYLLEQDPSDKRSRKEFLEGLLHTYQDNEKFKKAMDIETLMGFDSYIQLEITKEEELDARIEEMNKEWERIVPQLEEQSKREMQEAMEQLDAEMSAQEDEVSSLEQPGQSAPPEQSKDEENLILFDVGDTSTDSSDESRIAAMLADENSILARADEVSRCPHYPIWYRLRINTMAREAVLANTSIDPDKPILQSSEDTDKLSSVESILEYLFTDDDPAVKPEKYDDENSLSARAEEVLNSPWYPESYRKKMRNRLRASGSTVPESSSNDVLKKKSQRELEEDKRLLDMFLKEVENLPPEESSEIKDPTDRLFLKLGEGLAHFREAAMKRNSNVTLAHRKKRGD